MSKAIRIERLGAGGRVRVELHAPAPCPCPLLPGNARSDEVDPHSLAPTLRQRRHRRLEPLLGAFSPRPLVVRALADFRTLEDERDRSLRVRRGEEHRERTSFGLARHRCPLAADRVHHRADVVHPLLERRRARNAVGHAHPAFVEQDQPRELGEPLAVAPELRKLPVDLQVRIGALGVHEIDGTVPDDAVGDVDVAAPREAHLGHAARIEGYLRPKECGRGSDSHTVSSFATRRASGPSDSSEETRTLRFSPTRS